MDKIRRIKGTQDILPEMSSNWREIESIVRELMETYNYGEVRTPVFEHTELFARGIGQFTDIVSKEMYTFEDRGKKSITLKPEMTAPIVRSFIENNLQAQSPLTKIFYIAPLFRQENPQAGRLRQFHQFGAEALGSDSAMLDAELILLAMEIYKRLGISNLKLKINSVGDPNCREPYKLILQNYFRPLLNQYCNDCKNRFETNPMRILDCKNDSCKKLNINAPKLSQNLCSDCEIHFELVQSVLSENKTDFKTDDFLVRGLDYYTRTVFEITSENIGSQDAICGGGRYDLLVEQLGGKATPAVGFASGIERLLMVMESQNLLLAEQDGLDIFISPIGKASETFAAIWLQKLRGLGYKTDGDYLNRSLKAQMREANRQKAKLVFLLGEKEIESRCFTIKEMENSRQSEVAFEKVEAYLRKFFNSNKT